VKIDVFFAEFIKSLKYEKDLRKTAMTLLKGDREYCLPKMEAFEEADNLAANIQDSVRRMPRGKDTAIRVYRKLIDFLRGKGIEVSVAFPPIPVDSSFERQMFIAKYLQDEDARIEDLKNLLWVSERTIDEDLKRLYRDSDDPIQVCGQRFFIPESRRANGQMLSESTAHPLFLTENLTQVIVMLKGLRLMAGDPLYTRYAELTAADIWMQLSGYAKKRIRFVLGELLPEELNWYERLEEKADSFSSERECAVRGANMVDFIKNDRSFFVEYRTEDGDVIYDDCRCVHGSYEPKEEGYVIEVDCRQGRKRLDSGQILRSAYTPEELAW
jgi:hypothetical protein